MGDLRRLVQAPSTTELYPDVTAAALAELLAVTGTEAAVRRAEGALDRNDAVLAIRLGEAFAAAKPDDPSVRELMACAHRRLLEHGSDVSFWEDRWLRAQLGRWEATAAR